jgi:hypothetical protein
MPPGQYRFAELEVADIFTYCSMRYVKQGPYQAFNLTNNVKVRDVMEATLVYSTGEKHFPILIKIAASKNENA